MSAVIEYNVGDGNWVHGRSIPDWVVADREALILQRKAVRDHARESGEALDATPVRTRVRNEDDQ